MKRILIEAIVTVDDDCDHVVGAIAGGADVEIRSERVLPEAPVNPLSADVHLAATGTENPVVYRNLIRLSATVMDDPETTVTVNAGGLLYDAEFTDNDDGTVTVVANRQNGKRWTATTPGPRYAFFEVALSGEEFFTAVERAAVWRNQAAKHLSSEAQRSIVTDVLAAIGIGDAFETWADRRPLNPQGPDQQLVDAVRALIDYRPEGYDSQFVECAYDSGWTSASNVEDARLLFRDPEAWKAKANGQPSHERTGRMSFRRVVPDKGSLPFLSESVVYPIVGKDGGRSIKARLAEVRRLIGDTEGWGS